MNYTIYFRKGNWAKFKDEADKSELINVLLEEHYKQGSTSRSAGRKAQTRVVNAAIDLGQAIQGYKNAGPSLFLDASKGTNTTKLIPDNKDYTLCKHGAVKGFCKHGCK